MKKLMRKLVLSSFALGLAVITLSTTTFAWYTANTDVKANNILGTTSTSGSDLLMITQEYDDEVKLPTGWTTSINVVNKTSTKPTAMVPRSYTEPEKYDDPTIFQEQKGKVVTDSVDGWIEFEVFFKLASAKVDSDGNPVETKLYLSSISLTNTTKINDVAKLPTKDVLGEETGDSIFGTGEQKTTYQVNVLRTLMVSYTSRQYIHTVAGEKPEPTATFGKGIWNPEKFADLTAASYKDSLTSGFNAHQYYNDVMEGNTKDLESVEEKTYDALELGKDGATDPVVISVIPAADRASNANSYLAVTFRIFINGWDLACFDACQGQSFTINMGFTTESTDAIKA